MKRKPIPATVFRTFGEMNRSSSEPTRTPIPAAAVSASADPAKTAHLLTCLSAEKRSVASCVLSPISATKTVTKTVANVFQCIGPPVSPARGRNAGGYRKPLAPGSARAYDGPVRPAPPTFSAALAAAIFLVGAPGAAAPQELPKWGVISRPKGFSTVRVISQPGLSVFLDEKPVGTTDALQQGLVLDDLPAGTYTLRVEKPGYEPKVVRVVVAEGDTKEVRILGLKPKATPTAAPPGWTPPPGATPTPAPAPVRTVILDRKPVPGGTAVTGLASGPSDIVPLLDTLRAECGCSPALEELKKRKDGLYEFRVKLPGK